MLDTNVWLDLLVFRDAAALPLLAALQRREAEALLEPRMREELHRVLAYPALGLDPAARDAVAAEAARLATAVDRPAPPPTAPRCRDPDDQMFVDLALASRADALLSRDEAVLRLASRLGREGIDVLTPAAWCAAQISKR